MSCRSIYGQAASPFPEPKTPKRMPNPMASQLNIWTHAVGVVVVMSLYIRFLGSEWASGLNTADIVALSSAYFGSIICLALSSLYHMQISGPPDSIQLYFALDLTGIVVAIVGSYIAGIHAAWPCMIALKVVYLAPPVSSAVIQLFMLAWDHNTFLSKAWDNTRVLLFCSKCPLCVP